MCATLVFEMETEDSIDPVSWQDKWDGRQYSGQHCQYLVMLWWKMTMGQRLHMVDHYFGHLKGFERGREHLLLDCLIGVSHRLGNRDDLLATLASLARSYLTDELLIRALTVDERREWASLVLSVEGSRDGRIERIRDRAMALSLEQIRRSENMDRLKSGDPLALLQTYYRVFRGLGVRSCSSGEGFLRRLADVDFDRDPPSRIGGWPPVVAQTSSGPRVCVDFFDLADRLLQSKEDGHGAQRWREEAARKAREQMGDFFDVVLDTPEVSPHVREIIQSHRRLVVGALQ